MVLAMIDEVLIISFTSNESWYKGQWLLISFKFIIPTMQLVNLNKNVRF